MKAEEEQEQEKGKGRVGDPSAGVGGAPGTARRLFSFGVISDVQYADCEDGQSFAGVKRFYRYALQALRQVFRPTPTPPPPHTHKPFLPTHPPTHTHDTSLFPAPPRQWTHGTP